MSPELLQIVRLHDHLQYRHVYAVVYIVANVSFACSLFVKYTIRANSLSRSMLRANLVPDSLLHVMQATDL